MKVIYIAGKYTDGNKQSTNLNIDKAERISKKIWKNGMAAICPHLNTRNWNGLLSQDEFIEGYFSIVKKCDAMIMLDNWKDSEGAQAEHWLAASYGIPIFYNLNDLKEWKHIV